MLCLPHKTSIVQFALANENMLSIGCTIPRNTTHRFGPQIGVPKITTTTASIRTRNISTEASPENAFKERLQKIKNSHPEPYPRLATDSRRISCAEFLSRYNHLANNETVDDVVVLHGRSQS